MIKNPVPEYYQQIFRELETEKEPNQDESTENCTYEQIIILSSYQKPS